jgi:hypothetical protein
VINKTNITFTPQELTLLNKGLKYNLSFKKKNWIESLALEADTAISLLPPQEQDNLRFQVAHNIKQLYKQYDPTKLNQTKQYNFDYAKNEHRTTKKIKDKLEQNNALALKADKGNSIVIEYADKYNSKILHFITNNDFQITEKDPTKQFQNKVRTVIRESQSFICKEKRHIHVNLNPSAPTIRGLLKVHKDNCPIRPVINCENAPACKLAKLLNKLIATYIPLPYAYNVKDTIHLMEDLTEIP